MDSVAVGWFWLFCYYVYNCCRFGFLLPVLHGFGLLVTLFAVVFDFVVVVWLWIFSWWFLNDCSGCGFWHAWVGFLLVGCWFVGWLGWLTWFWVCGDLLIVIGVLDCGVILLVIYLLFVRWFVVLVLMLVVGCDELSGLVRHSVWFCTGVDLFLVDIGWVLLGLIHFLGFGLMVGFVVWWLIYRKLWFIAAKGRLLVDLINFVLHLTLIFGFVVCWLLWFSGCLGDVCFELVCYEWIFVF